MITHPAQQRSMIRTQCRNLRKQILSRRPANILPLLLEVGSFECSVLTAGPDEFGSIRINLMLLAHKIGSAGDQ